MIVLVLVDEDFDALRAWTEELKLRGHEVRTIDNAHAAFKVLWNAPIADVDLVLIDVMLAPGPGGRDPLTAGIELLADLVQQNPAVFPGRAAFITASIGTALRQARRVAASHDMEVIDKHTVLSAAEFADRVERILERRAMEDRHG